MVRLEPNCLRSLDTTTMARMESPPRAWNSCVVPMSAAGSLSTSDQMVRRSASSRVDGVRTPPAAPATPPAPPGPSPTSEWCVGLVHGGQPLVDALAVQLARWHLREAAQRDPHVGNHVARHDGGELGRHVGERLRRYLQLPVAVEEVDAAVGIRRGPQLLERDHADELGACRAPSGGTSPWRAAPPY